MRNIGAALLPVPVLLGVGWKAQPGLAELRVEILELHLNLLDCLVDCDQA